MKNKFDIGLIGLGVMGRNLILNISEKGYSVLGYDIEEDNVQQLNRDKETQSVQGVTSIHDLLSGLESPRKVMLSVPASVVEDVIMELIPLLEEGDLIIDGGNSHPDDTERRTRIAEEKGLKYLGMGISGGAEGASKGPSIMPGGDLNSYNLVEDILKSAAAIVRGEPCVAYMGNRSAGHFVKMVHNGIEYGIMQVISEVYDIMKRGINLSNQQIHNVFKVWDQDKLQSFLVHISTDIFIKKDESKDGYLLDYILDMAKQKGTGKWTSQAAMDLQVPVPTIDTAVTMRHITAFKNERKKGENLLSGPDININVDKGRMLEKLGNTLYFSMMVIFAQGLELLRVASDKKDFDIPIQNVVKVWRGGCIIRASLLDDILDVFIRKADIDNILLDPEIAEKAEENAADARLIINLAASSGIPLSGIMSALGYFDAYRSSWLPGNLIQAQRDYFGSHKYERVDMEGAFHTEW